MYSILHGESGGHSECSDPVHILAVRTIPGKKLWAFFLDKNAGQLGLTSQAVTVLGDAEQAQNMINAPQTAWVEKTIEYMQSDAADVE